MIITNIFIFKLKMENIFIKKKDNYNTFFKLITQIFLCQKLSLNQIVIKITKRNEMTNVVKYYLKDITNVVKYYLKDITKVVKYYLKDNNYIVTKSDFKKTYIANISFKNAQIDHLVVV